MARRRVVHLVVALFLLFSLAMPCQVLAMDKIDINSASVSELQELPGVGSKTAQRIVEYRSQHGPFQSVDGLMNVKGIGAKKLDKIRAMATVGQ